MNIGTAVDIYQITSHSSGNYHFQKKPTKDTKMSWRDIFSCMAEVKRYENQARG